MTNLKTKVKRKQSTPFFPKNEHLLPPDTHTYMCPSGCKKCSFFGNIINHLFGERINPFHATGLFLYPLKTPENQM